VPGPPAEESQADAVNISSEATDDELRKLSQQSAVPAGYQAAGGPALPEGNTGIPGTPINTPTDQSGQGPIGQTGSAPSTDLFEPTSDTGNGPLGGGAGGNPVVPPGAPGGTNPIEPVAGGPDGVQTTGPALPASQPTPTDQPSAPAVDQAPTVSITSTPTTEPSTAQDLQANPTVGLPSNVVAEIGLLGGQYAALRSTAGVITVGDPDGIGDIANVVVAGKAFTVLQLAQITADPSTQPSIALVVGDGDQKSEGNLTLTSFNSVTGEIGYRFELTDPVNNANPDKVSGINDLNATIPFSVVVFDVAGKFAVANASILIIDSVPSVNILDSSPSQVNEGSQISGIWTGSFGADVIGAAYKVIVNGVSYQLGQPITTPEGTLTVFNGSNPADFVWTLNAHPDTPYLEGTQSITFSVEVTDGDGDKAIDSHRIVVVDTITEGTKISLSDPTVNEGGTVTVTASVPENATPQTTDLVLTLSNGQTITIPAGQTTGSVTFPVQGDDPYIDPETFSLSITGSTGGNYEKLDTSDKADVSVKDTIDTTKVVL
jgi:hypothetical protein